MNRPTFSMLFLTALALLWGASLSAQEGLGEVNSKEEMIDKVIERVQKIIGNTEERLALQEPITDTLPPAVGEPQGRILKLWMENEKAVKLTVTEAGEEGEMDRQSTYYFGGPDLFFVAQPHARFILIQGRLEFWLNENWDPIPASAELLYEREGLLYDEANRYLSWFFGDRG